MTVEAPSARPLTMWPTFWIPPSAMQGTPKRAANEETLKTDAACGRPTAMTSWVMHALPLPMPILRPSTPAVMRFAAWATVTTLPPMTSRPV